jgi:hypothetical protein
MAYFRMCTDAGAEEFRRCDSHVRRRLRAVAICYRQLVARRASPAQAARVAYSERGVWHRSNRPGTTKRRLVPWPAWFAV